MIEESITLEDVQNTGKKVVHYKGGTQVIGNGGHFAMLHPVDHPDSERVSNTKLVMTSKVVRYDKRSGTIETENTIYIPLRKDLSE